MSGTFFSLIVKKYDNEFVVSQVGQIILSFDCLIWLFFILVTVTVLSNYKVFTEILNSLLRQKNTKSRWSGIVYAVKLVLRIVVGHKTSQNIASAIGECISFGTTLWHGVASGEKVGTVLHICCVG